MKWNEHRQEVSEANYILTQHLHLSLLILSVFTVLLNPIIQKNVQSWKQKFGAEIVDTFLKSNGENIVRGKEKANRMKNKKIQKKHTKKRTDNSDDESVDEDDDKDMSSNEEEAVDDSQGTADVKESREKKQEESTKSTNKKPSKKPANKKTIDRPEKKPKLIQMSKTSDPFFVDSSGGNYLASIANADSGADESDEERPRKTFNREKRPVQLKKSFKKPIRQRRFDETPPKPPTRFVRNDEKPKTAIQITSNDADVHPSWKAKANLRKQSMAEFTGTKIKFDD